MSLPPILLDFPDSFETERLLVRALRPGDGAALNEAILESHAELRAWMPWARGKPSVDESESRARTSAAEWLLRTDLAVLFLLKDGGTLVGGSGLHRIDWDVRRFEIGYWCRTTFVGQGYVTEAVTGLARFAFDHLGARRVEIRCDTRNTRSIRVAELAGFEPEGTLRADCLDTDGKHRDTRVFALVR